MNKRQRLRHERDLLAQEGIIGTKQPMGTRGLGLFESEPACYQRCKAATSPTSEKARVRNAPRKITQRERIFDLLVRVRPAGLTRPEIAQHLGMKNANSANGRCAELIEHGHAYDGYSGPGGERDKCAIVYATRTTYDHGAFR